MPDEAERGAARGPVGETGGLEHGGHGARQLIHAPHHGGLGVAQRVDPHEVAAGVVVIEHPLGDQGSIFGGLLVRHHGPSGAYRVRPWLRTSDIEHRRCGRRAEKARLTRSVFVQSVQDTGEPVLARVHHGES